MSPLFSDFSIFMLLGSLCLFEANGHYGTTTRYITMIVRSRIAYMIAKLHVMSLDGSHQIASLMHLWDSILREYILLVTFTKELDVKLKSLLLAAAFLMEYVYFKEEASSEGRVLFPTM